MNLMRQVRTNAKHAFNDRNMTAFLHHAFRYMNLRDLLEYQTVFGPGDLLNDIIEEQIFDSKN